MHNACSRVRVLARQLEHCELAADVAVCGSLLWMVATSDALNCLNGSRAMVQWNGRRGALLSRGSAFATGTCQVATIPARSELERPREAYFEAICACLHLTFVSARLSWSGQVGLSHGMRSGSSILYRLALGLRTCLPKPAHMLLTVCFRFSSWTGQSDCDFARNMDRFSCDCSRRRHDERT